MGHDESMISTLVTTLALTGALAGAPPATEPPLTDTRWVVTHLVDGPATTPVTAARPAYLILHSSGEVEGYDSCNWVTAAAAATDADTLTFTEFGTTKRLCHDSAFRVEMAYGHLLDGEIDYRIDTGSLWLVHPDGSGLVLSAEAP